MKDFKNKVAAITGAASGMGRTLALDLASRGCHLVLSVVNEAGLAETAAMAGKLGVRVTTARLDVAKREAMFAWADQVVADHGKVNLIFNNAGVALSSTIEGMEDDELAWIMNINFWGVVHGTRAFLPHLARQRAAHIVNLSSIFGIIAPPGQSAYAAAKFAVRGFSESLRHELATANSPIRLSVVHPGGVATAIARNARAGHGMTDNARRVQAIERFERLARTTPREAAQRIIQGIERNEPRILIGGDARIMDLLQRFMPGTYWKVMAKRLEKAAAKQG